MNADRLLAFYDRVADAPGAVRRLRRFVLDLAVRGELVRQDPADEPVSELLAQARRDLRERAQSAARVRWKEAEPIAPKEIQAEVPAGWVPARVNDTGMYVNGLAFRPDDWKESGTPIIRIQNLTDPSKAFNFAEGDFPDEVIVRDGDLLVSWSATLDAFRWDRGEGVLNQHIFRVIPASGLTTRDFLLLLLKAAIRRLADSDHAHGLVMKHINRRPFLNHVVLIPPLAEQHRIVAKVDELVALCDQLEEGRTAREDTRDRLTRASFVRLAATDTDSSTVRSHARFAVEVLSALTARADQLKHLRQMISSLAFCGKLVEQDPQEGSGHDVHARLTSARKPSLGTGSLSKSMDGMYPLPSSWTWVSLGQAIVAGPRNGLSPRSSAREDAPRAVTLTATTSGVFDGAHFKRVDVDIGPDSEYWLQPNDLLFQRGNTPEYVGMAAIYNGPPGKFLFPDLMIRVRLSPDVSLRFVHLFCISPAARSYFSENAVGAQKTMPKINQTILRSLPIPLPPLAEQHRIVAKVDELMALCDRLKAGLGAAEVTRGHLLDSLIHESLASHEAARIWSTLGAAGGGA